MKLELVFKHNNFMYPNRDLSFCEYIKRRHILDSTCCEKQDIFFSTCFKMHSWDIHASSQSHFKHIPSNFVYSPSSFFIEIYKINEHCAKAIEYIAIKYYV
ncbi:hypothetical protein CDIK_3475 [Cucumispora dikerogammari]|nr:hypothetical protein CDIK_3475 [Cucumispora dikerogammari]